MAGDWIKMDVGLPEKPEVWQIAGMVGIDADTVVGKLLKVWRWFDAHTEDGNAVGVTYALVDHIAGVTGFGEAMALVRWLEQDGSVMRLPNFDRHNGKTAKNRALTAKRVAACKAKGNAGGNGEGVTGALPREEKNREEKKDQKQDQKPELPPAAAEDDPIALMISAGVEYITSTGVGEKQARSLIGMLRKARGDVDAAHALAKLQAERIADPGAWIARAARVTPKSRGQPTAADSFHGKTYAGTPVDRMPAHLRPESCDD